jgi:hypothetical protein
MHRLTWLALAVVFAAGVVTAWHSYRLQSHHPDAAPARDVEPRLLAVSTLPTGLFLAAALLGRRSGRVQLAVAAAAVLVGVLRVMVIRGELAADWSSTTGLMSGAAWAIGMGVAGVVLLAGAATAVVRAIHERRAAAGRG